MTQEERDQTIIYLQTQQLSIYSTIETLNREMRSVENILKERFLVKTRIKNTFYPINYDELEKEKDLLIKDLQYYGSILSKINELMGHFYGLTSKYLDVIV